MNPQANKHLLLWSSLATLALLGWAAFRENHQQEWRRLQRQYRARLAPEAAAEFKVQLRQIVVPALHESDRCVTCHVGMAPGEAGVPGDRIFTKHPNVTHDPTEYGCTVCHGGQGRATESAAAHGDVEHWPEPMIPARFSHAGCGTCHTHLAVPRIATLAHGQALVERDDCLACHELDGRGGTTRPGGAGGMVAPSLSRVGLTGWDAGWYAKHLAQRDTSRTAAWKTSFDTVSESDREALDTFLASRVGAPGLIEAKAMFHSKGCRGCHKVGGVGGDDGPDLSREGQIDPGQRPFARVEGPHTVANWLMEHFRKPSVVVAGSLMPEQGLSEKEVEQLTFYMLSLRRSNLPENYSPRDRIQAMRFGAREFSTDGATLYGTFCAACHGAAGEGMRYPGLAAFPAIGNPDFLAIASDDFIRATVRQGRRGRRMPAWGATDGGLRPAEIDSVVAWVRVLGGRVPAVPDLQPRRWVRGDAALGARLYAGNCAGCHGRNGEGNEGPALANADLLANAADTYLFETIRRGRRGSSMLGFTAGSVTRRALTDAEIEAVIAYIRSWEAHP